MASDCSLKTSPLPPPSRNLLPVSNSYSLQLCTLPSIFNLYVFLCLSRNLTHVIFLSFFHSCLEVSKKWKLAAPAF